MFFSLFLHAYVIRCTSAWLSKKQYFGVFWCCGFFCLFVFPINLWFVLLGLIVVVSDYVQKT